MPAGPLVAGWEGISRPPGIAAEPLCQGPPGHARRGFGTGDVMDDDLLADMGDATIGAVTAHIYSAAHASKKNEEFVAAYRKAYKSRPGFMAVGGYDGIHLVYAALQKTGGISDGTKLISAMKGMAWESPRGPISIDPETRDIVQNVYIRKVEKLNGEPYNVEFETISSVKDPGKIKN